MRKLPEGKIRNDDTLEKKWSYSHKISNYEDPGIDCSHDVDQTDQSGAEEADINNIVSRYHKTGILPGIDRPAVFADVSNAPTYEQALQVVINAEAQFMAMDATTRKRFDNDPSQFLEFLDNPNNAEELVKMGLATLREPTPSPAAPESLAAPQRSSKTKPKTESAPADE